MRGGKRAGSGRKKNSPNKASAKREREAAASGATPLDVMLRSMRLLLALAGESVNDKKQFEHYIRPAAAVAKDVAPYIHPRLSTVEKTTPEPNVQYRIEVIGGLPVG